MYVTHPGNSPLILTRAVSMSDPSIVEIVEAAVLFTGAQLRDHSEAVFQAGLQIELQGRGANVQTEVPTPVLFELSWSGSLVTVGHVRLDCIVIVNQAVVVLEVKRTAGKHGSQLQKYLNCINPAWGLALVTPDGTEWIRNPGTV